MVDQMTDLAGILTNAGDVVTLGAQRFRRKLRAYTLNLTRTAVVSASFPGTIQIDPGLAPFVMTSLHAGDTADGNALTSQEDWLVTIQDNENGYLWTDGYVPRTALFGDRILGYILPNSSSLRANTRVSVTVQNKAAGAVAGVATITLRGWTLIPY